MENRFFKPGKWKQYSLLSPIYKGSDINYGRGDCKKGGGITKFWVPFMGGSQNFWYLS